MKITVLTPEESLEFWNKEKEERLKWTTQQIIQDARMMMNMPDMGNTKYLLSEDIDEFYKWLETDEAREVWNKDPFTLELARYYSINKIK